MHLPFGQPVVWFAIQEHKTWNLICKPITTRLCSLLCILCLVFLLSSCVFPSPSLLQELDDNACWLKKYCIKVYYTIYKQIPSRFATLSLDTDRLDGFSYPCVGLFSYILHQERDLSLLFVISNCHEDFISTQDVLSLSFSKYSLCMEILQHSWWY